MPSPYLLEAPALLSFSGGRTSAYLLRQVLDASAGQLPDGVAVVFCNTGREMPQTLDFVRDCSKRWAVPVAWLEYWPGGEKGRKFRLVDHATASRNGEPYEALLKERGYLPNPASRFCSVVLTIRVMRDYARSLGWEHWINAVGLRFDEPRRVAKLKDQRERWETLAPLYEARVTKEDVAAFWRAQPFDLQLPNLGGKTPAGNCDLCFLKSARTISGLIADNPALAAWWVRMEDEATPRTLAGKFFRIDRPSYRQMRDAVLAQKAFDFGERDQLAECYCTE